MITAFELTHSVIAEKMGMDNFPWNETTVSNLLNLMSVLASVRAKVNYPIKITSGYRNPTLNKAVGGAPNSAHQFGLAADIKLKNISQYLEVSKFFRIFAEKIGFGSIVIHEKPVKGVPSWIHLELSKDPLTSKTFTIK